MKQARGKWSNSKTAQIIWVAGISGQILCLILVSLASMLEKIIDINPLVLSIFIASYSLVVIAAIALIAGSFFPRFRSYGQIRAVDEILGIAALAYVILQWPVFKICISQI